MLSLANNLHLRVLQRIIKAKSIFYDNNPTGKILFRLGNDINELDKLLPYVFVDFF